MHESKKQSLAVSHDPREVESAEYIADLTTQLASLARRSKHDFLGYLLDIASEEARMTADRRQDARSGADRRRIVQAVQG